MVCPSGPKVANPTALSIGMATGRPPATGTLYRLWIQPFHWLRLVRKTTDWESGVQVTTILSGPWRPPVPASVVGL